MQKVIQQSVHTAKAKISKQNGFIKASVYILIAFSTVLIGYVIGILIGMVFV